MRIKKLSNFLIESRVDINMKYYSFDWDDNILHMPTKILMDRKTESGWEPVDVSTTEFTIVRHDTENYRLRNGSDIEAFSEFRDTGSRKNKAFLEDTISAVNANKKAPSWNKFIRCLTEGSLFSIITARGHEPESIREAIEWILDNVLTEEQKFLMYSNCLKFAYWFSPHNIDDYPRIARGQFSKNELIKNYLDTCSYYGVSSKSFADEFGSGSAKNPEEAKKKALNKFVDTCNSFATKIGASSVSIGFSDDDPKNERHIRVFFMEKIQSMTYPHEVRLSVYATSDPEVQGGVKTSYKSELKRIIDAGSTNESQSSYGIGMSNRGSESSVLPFTSWNSMTKNLYPATADVPKDDFHNQFKNKVGQVGDITKDTIKKIKKDNGKVKKVRKIRK